MQAATREEDEEATDAEILAEIAREEAEEERIRLEMIANGSLPNPNASDAHSTINDTRTGTQLTRFQESIITTGMCNGMGIHVHIYMER